jgi:AcrR family transcriptional regulator
MAFTEKQQQIIQIAEKLFAEKGFEGTSVRDIAEEASVNVAMISYYFGSKEQLLEAIFTNKSEIVSLTIDALLKDKKISALQKLDILIDYYIDRLQVNTCFHKIMQREQVTQVHSKISAMITEYRKKVLELLKPLVQEGQKSGEFKQHIDISMLMATMIGTAAHFITTQHTYREMNNLESLSEEEFKKHIKKKLGNYLKNLFKAILTHE